ncbi:MAG: tetratricopeptide repeat protein [Anaerolineales bacterium]|nr:tetratricopeptide repeat protein [Anaerolineales bacterium]
MADFPINNLPVFSTPFVGRARESAQVCRQMRSTRLLTLTGAGGCGKTRLALHAASLLLPEFGDGVWWCDLSPVTDPLYVPRAVAAVWGLSEPPDRSLLDALTDALRSQCVLLILDNCEHVLAACAALTRALLEGCPNVRVLATSLQPLGLPQEQVWQAPPLALPERADTARESDAVQLFTGCAARALPSFQLTSDNLDAVTSICRRLDGLPLAIELAAARVKVLSLAQIAERLDDACRLLTRGAGDSLPRHQTLRATMDWSYQFLTEPEQVLLRRLSVFAGSFTLEMAEAVCGAELTEPGVLDLLTELVEKSWVSMLPREAEAPPRFRLLETIRQYSRERLEAAGETAATRSRHLAWCASFAAQLEAKLAGPEARPALALLDANLDNLRLALQWVRVSREMETGLRLAGSLWMFWQSRGYLTEGRNWLEELLRLQAALPADSASVSPPVLAKAQYAAAALAFRQSDFPRATTLAEASLEVTRAAQDLARLGAPLTLLGILATEQGDYARAAALHEESLALYRRLGDGVRTSNALINLGALARRQGAYRRALECYEEALNLKRQIGDTSGVALALSNLGDILIAQGKIARGLAALEESLLLYRELGNKAGMVSALNNLGAAARCSGEAARARACLEEAVALCQGMNDRMRLSFVWINLGDLARDEGNLAQAQSLYADALAQLEAIGDQAGRALALYALGLTALARQDEEHAQSLLRQSLSLYHSLALPSGLVESLEALAEATRRQGQPQRAARWLAAAAAQREALEMPVLPPERGRHEQTLAALRTALGQAAFESAWSEGHAVSLEQIVAEALGEERPTEVPAAAPVPEWRAFALGASRVLVGERNLTDTDWTYLKAKELFFYLLLHPAATKEQIGLDLWPEASPTQLRSAFHRTMHHLRRALGKAEWVVFENEAYALNRALPHWFDVQTFEAALTQAGRALQSAVTPAGRAEAARRLEEALSLYQGDFLADMDAGEWAISRREELRRRSLEARLTLGELYFSDARYGLAAEVYRRLIALEPYLETAHRELMRCLARLGETAQAVQHYQRLSRLLSTELRTQPAPETTFLFERLRRGDDV